MNYVNNEYAINAIVVKDNYQPQISSYITITDAPHMIEFDWQAASADGANDGSLTIWIDDTQAASLTGVDNDTQRVSYIKFCAVTGIDANTQGTIYFDAFESNLGTYIGYAADMQYQYIFKTISKKVLAKGVSRRSSLAAVYDTTTEVITQTITYT